MWEIITLLTTCALWRGKTSIGNISISFNVLSLEYMLKLTLCINMEALRSEVVFICVAINVNVKLYKRNGRAVTDDTKVNYRL